MSVLKKYFISFLVLFFMILLMVSCLYKSKDSLEQSALPSDLTSKTPTEQPIATPSIVPMPEFEYILRTYEENDIDLKLDISMEFLDPADYKEDSPWRLIAEKIYEDYLIWKDDIKKMSLEQQGEYYPTFGFQLISSMAVCNTTDGLASLFVDYYTYTGGAHGITIRVPYNFSYESKTFLELGDLASDNPSFNETIQSEINRQIKENLSKPDYGYFEDKVDFGTNPLTSCFYILNGRLIIFFQPYEIAPYVMGIPEFEMPASIYPGE